MGSSRSPREKVGVLQIQAGEFHEPEASEIFARLALDAELRARFPEYGRMLLSEKWEERAWSLFRALRYYFRFFEPPEYDEYDLDDLGVEGVYTNSALRNLLVGHTNRDRKWAGLHGRHPLPFLILDALQQLFGFEPAELLLDSEFVSAGSYRPPIEATLAITAVKRRFKVRRR